MFKLFAVVLLGLGIFIGLKYNDEINDIINSDAVEEIYEDVNDVVDEINN